MPAPTKEKPAKQKKAPGVQKVFRDAIEWLKDPEKPWPGAGAPFCLKCKLDTCGAKTPYMLPVGSTTPTITFVYDAPSRKEDAAGGLTEAGAGAFIRKAAVEMAKTVGLDPSTFRFVSATRCAVIEGKLKAETGAKHCRHYVLDDLRAYRPQVIVPIGSSVLGLFSHKSNVQDWGGRLLTFRGWFDDWLIDPKFKDGHPVYGDRPTAVDRILMVPIQKPQMVFASRNPRVIARWKGQLKRAMELVLTGSTPLVYDRPWWRITDDPAVVEEALAEIKANPGTIVTYDTETTGLRPFLNDKIVFMMIRWNSPDGTPKALGWPWDYRSSFKPAKADPEIVFEESPMLPYLSRLSPQVLEAFSVSKLRGHNLTFDLLFTIGTLEGGRDYLDRLCEAWHEDTWHMRYALKQERGSIGLEIVAYDWAKDLAGYEEEFSLLIDQYRDLLHPKEGGHYANCPRDKWDETFRPYVMGDVEVCHLAAENIGDALAKTPRHAFPLAHPIDRGRFRKYSPPNREFVYRKLIGPAGGLLAKLMARGMYLDPTEVANQEALFPKLIWEARDKLRASVPALSSWCDAKEAEDPTWEFDLQDQKLLKEALFGVLRIPVASITDAGLKIFGALEKATPEGLIKYASTDKFALNHMAVNHPEVRELLKYRSLHKQYTSYVRPLHNITTKGIDKNPRKGSQLLMNDSCVHAQFKIAGTRGGRLACCVDGDTVLEIYRNGLRELVKIRELEWSDTDEVLIRTHENRLRPIVRKYLKAPAEQFKVKLENGSTIICTAGHRFYSRGSWKHLRDLSEGDYVSTGAGPERVQNSSRIGLCTPVGKLDWAERDEGSRFSEESQPQNDQRVFEPRVRGSTTCDSRSQSLKQAAWQHKRLTPTKRHSSTSRIGTDDQKWKDSSSDCGPLWCIALHGGTKPTALFHESVCEELWFTEVFDRNSTGSSGSRRAWFVGSLQELCERSNSVPDKNLQRVFDDVASSLVDSGLVQNSNHGHTEKDGSSCSKRNCVANQQSRSSSFVGASPEENQARQRVRLARIENGRFWDHWNERAGRSGWRHSRNQSHRDSGQNQDSESRVSGLHRSEVQVRRSVGKHDIRAGQDSGSFESRIVAITAVGARPVWDIEVEEDHSYVAHGFVNHNSEPNLQQLPREGPIKKQFVSRFGRRGCIYQADLSQIELRLLAAACGDPLMVKAYWDGIDLHSLTTSLVFDVPYEHFGEEYEIWLQKNGKADEAKKLKGIRKIGKTLNFLTGYGGGAYGFQSALALQGVYIQLDEGERHIANFFEKYSCMKKHIGHYKQFILDNGRAVSITGRVRIFDEVYSDDFGQVARATRAGYNHLIQATASDMMLLSMYAIETLMRQDNMESMLVSTVHDSLAIDAVKAEVPAIHAIVSEVLSNIPTVMSALLGDDYDTSWAIVPFAGDSALGKSYGDEMKIPAKGNIDWDEIFTRAGLQ